MSIKSHVCFGLMLGLFVGLSSFVFAEMRYNPINNLLYSHPETSEINQDEYRSLLFGCLQLEARMKAINNKQPSNKDVLNQCVTYLKMVGTPTALRLMADIKKNTIKYANGQFMKKILT